MSAMSFPAFNPPPSRPLQVFCTPVVHRRNGLLAVWVLALMLQDAILFWKSRGPIEGTV